MSVTACFKLAPLSIKAQLFGLALVGSLRTGELVNDRHHRFHQFEESAERLLRGTRRTLLGLQFGESLLHTSLVHSILHVHTDMLSNGRHDANSARFAGVITRFVKRWGDRRYCEEGSPLSISAWTHLLSAQSASTRLRNARN